VQLPLAYSAPFRLCGKELLHIHLFKRVDHREDL
jgi:hypothetical protein